MTRVVSAFFIATVAFAAPAQRQLLDAGKGQRPFDVTTHSVPLNEIANGGPARDAIPALDHPKFVAAKDADRFLRGKDRVLAVSMNGAAKAYPVKILNWHEIVNDEVVVSQSPSRGDRSALPASCMTRGLKDGR